MKQISEQKIKEKRRLNDVRKNKPDKKIKLRANIIVALLCVIGFAIGFLGILRAQLINGEKYRNAALRQQYSDVKIQADRGMIYDANMKVLAKSAAVFKVFVDPHNIKNEADREIISQILSKRLEMPYEEILEKTKNSKSRYVVIKSQVEFNVKESIVKDLKQHKGLSNAVGYDSDVKRYYPFGNSASTVLGFTGDKDRGLNGIEYYYDNELTGIPGRSITAKNALSQSIGSEYDKIYSTQNGQSLVLTIDSVVQHYLDDALSQVIVDKKANYGCGIVMNVKTGAILAMSTKPDFNLNEPSKLQNPVFITKLDEIKDEAEQKAYKKNAIKEQWKNRCITDSYEPGSVFKCFTASAALEENVVSMKDEFYCSGKIQIADKTYNCSNHSGHGKENIKDGLVNSCNPIFIEIGQKMGSEKFFKYFEAFGFTEKTGVDLPSEMMPIAGKTYHDFNNLGKVQLASSSFGQTFQITPLQILTAICSLGNDGKLMTPYIVDRVLDENQNTIIQNVPTVKRQVVSPKTAKTVVDMMEEGVKSGIAKNAYIPGYRVAGKTGTSQKLLAKGKYISSFAGLAPADDPEIAILIMVDEPEGTFYGSVVAAPTAAEVLKNTLNYYNIEPEYTDEELAKLNIKVPEIIGKDSKEAAIDLQNKGFSVKVIGNKGKVIAQFPAINNLIAKNGTILLMTEKNSKIPNISVPNFEGMNMTQAVKTARSSGINLKMSGYIKGKESLVYRQSAKAGTSIPYASTVTIYFKSSENVADF
ncbi:MAG: penicillin-binding transpeptidase domain-containing protein [Clostridia bacterium]|nr:penicillin-binding transpeptidase domain-containing protein [Clostridia bacterium]